MRIAAASIIALLLVALFVHECISKGPLLATFLVSMLTFIIFAFGADFFLGR